MTDQEYTFDIERAVALPIGLELDELVGLMVMGDQRGDFGGNVAGTRHFTWRTATGVVSERPPFYSSDVTEAWPVLGQFPSHVLLWDPTKRQEFCSIGDGENQPLGEAWAETAPLAICRAALLARAKQQTTAMRTALP